MGICFGKSPRQSDSTKVPIPKPNQPYPNPHEELVIHPTKPIQQKNPYYPNAGQYVALYDYKARLDGDLTFTRGDRMVILNNSQWVSKPPGGSNFWHQTEGFKYLKILII